jgi:hypothetical protein
MSFNNVYDLFEHKYYATPFRQEELSVATEILNRYISQLFDDHQGTVGKWGATGESR